MRKLILIAHESQWHNNSESPTGSLKANFRNARRRRNFPTVLVHSMTQATR